MRKNDNVYWLRPGELAVWRGHSVLILDDRGGLANGMEGLYFRRTRFLSRCVLMGDGRHLDYVSANPVRAHSLISYHLSPSPAGSAARPHNRREGGEIAHKAIAIEVQRFVGNGLHQDIHVAN